MKRKLTVSDGYMKSEGFLLESVHCTDCGEDSPVFLDPTRPASPLLQCPKCKKKNATLVTNPPNENTA